MSSYNPSNSADRNNQREEEKGAEYHNKICSEPLSVDALQIKITSWTAAVSYLEKYQTRLHSNAPSTVESNAQTSEMRNYVPVQQGMGCQHHPGHVKVGSEPPRQTNGALESQCTTQTDTDH